MAKSSVSEKKSEKRAAKSPASYAKKGTKPPASSKENPSKYAPTQDAEMDIRTLGGEDGLVKLFTDSVKDLYWAENQLVKALPKMAKAASTPQLSKTILEHHKQTMVHVARLEEVFKILGKKPQAKKCDAMEGLTKEGEGIVEDTDPGTPARNLGIIMASQKVEHYEISAYTGLIKLAEKIGLPKAGKILTTTLQEEIKSDELLGMIADNNIPVKD